MTDWTNSDMPNASTHSTPKIRRADERFCTRNDAEGKETWHSFSFGNHYDPERIGFGPIMAINEERLAPGAGYEPHVHRDVDIVTWVLEGTLAHEDSTGIGGLIEPGTLQYLSAGPGVTHSENNASTSEPLVFVQMMVRADLVDEPVHGQVQIPNEPGLHPGPEVNADAQIYIARLSPETPVEIPAAKSALVHVTRGTVTFDDAILGAGDECTATGSTGTEVTSAGEAEAIVCLVN